MFVDPAGDGRLAWPSVRPHVMQIWDPFANMADARVLGILRSCCELSGAPGPLKGAILANARFETIALTSVFMMLAYAIIADEAETVCGPMAADTQRAYRSHLAHDVYWRSALHGYAGARFEPFFDDAARRYVNALTSGVDDGEGRLNTIFARHYSEVFGQDMIPLALIGFLTRTLVAPCIKPDEAEAIQSHYVLSAILGRHEGMKTYFPGSTLADEMAGPLAQLYDDLVEKSLSCVSQMQEIVASCATVAAKAVKSDQAAQAPGNDAPDAAAAEQGPPNSEPFPLRARQARPARAIAPHRRDHDLRMSLRR